MTMTGGRPPAKPPVEEPFKHVIDQYRHRAQEVTCTCGWRGSSASTDGFNSEWKAHLAANRGAARR